MRASEKNPAASSSTSRKAVKLPWLIAQRDRLNPFEGLVWMRSADMEHSPRLRLPAHRFADLLALARKPDAHAVAQELHARGHHHVAGLQAAGDGYADVGGFPPSHRGLAHDL